VIEITKLSFYTKIFLFFSFLFAFVGMVIRFSIPYDIETLTDVPDILYYIEFVESFPLYSNIHTFNGLQFYGVIYLPHFYIIYNPITFVSMDVQLIILGLIIFGLVFLTIRRVESLQIHTVSKMFIDAMLCYHLLKGVYYCNMELIVICLCFLIITGKKFDFYSVLLISLFSFKIITFLLIIILLLYSKRIKYLKYILLLTFLLNFWYLFVIHWDIQYIIYVFTHGFDTTLASSDILTILSRTSIYLPIPVLEIELSYKIYEKVMRKWSMERKLRLFLTNKK
jgi:hypothetical protein